MDAKILLLLVEDEEAIALFAEAVLEDGGYTVVTTGSATEAIVILDERIGEIAGLVTDINLAGGPNGWEVARHARELNPRLPVVYTTGHGAADWAAQGVPNSVVLQKPYVEAQLLTAVSTLLIQPDSNAGQSQEAPTRP